MSTYTDEEVEATVKAAVDKATADLRAKLTDLESAAQTTEVKEAVAAARAELQAEIEARDAEVASVASKLDEAVLAGAAEKERADKIVAWLEAEAAEAAAAELVASRKADRVSKVKEVACFPDEYLEANADRFAAMGDEDFETALESFKAITAGKGDGGAGGTPIPALTGLHASRDTTTSKGTSVVKGFMAQRRAEGRVDFSSLGGGAN